MSVVGEYILRITAAAIVCCIAQHIIGGWRPAGRIVRMVSGMLLAVTVLTPVVDFRLDEFRSALEDHRLEAAVTVRSGEEMALSAMKDIIKENTEAYILDEAEKLGMDVAVEVKLEDSDLPVPYQVFITGAVSPYNKSALSSYIKNSLGISQENQKWI